MSDFYTWIIIAVVLTLIWWLLAALIRIQREDKSPKRTPVKKRKRTPANKQKRTRKPIPQVEQEDNISIPEEWLIPSSEEGRFTQRICATPDCDRPAVPGETLCKHCNERQHPPLRFPTQKDFGHYR